jgi:hypothetical protein
MSRDTCVACAALAAELDALRVEVARVHLDVRSLTRWLVITEQRITHVHAEVHDLHPFRGAPREW